MCVQELMAGHVPSWEELDRLADALSGIDYYLERLASENPGGAEDVLDWSQRSLDALDVSAKLRRLSQEPSAVAEPCRKPASGRRASPKRPQRKKEPRKQSHGRCGPSEPASRRPSEAPAPDALFGPPTTWTSAPSATRTRNTPNLTLEMEETLTSISSSELFDDLIAGRGAEADTAVAGIALRTRAAEPTQPSQHKPWSPPKARAGAGRGAGGSGGRLRQRR
jgi:hypothetical protein